MTHTLLVLIILSFFANIHLSVADSSTSGTAQVRASELIEGSYLLTFKAPENGEQPLVSVYSKEEIAQLLQVNGQVVSVFATINTIHILVAAEEAARLSKDPRVLRVEQDSMVTTMPVQSASASYFPHYKDGVLTIPRVDTSMHLGQYQDVKLQFTEQGGWVLLDYKAVGEDISLAYIDSVNVVQTNSVPIQVFLEVEGSLPNECFDIGQVNQRLDANQFNVVVSAIFSAPEGTLCNQALVPFKKVIPLDVYGLQAGTYTYYANGITGFFKLAVDNTLPTTTVAQ